MGAVLPSFLWFGIVEWLILSALSTWAFSIALWYLVSSYLFCDDLFSIDSYVYLLKIFYLKEMIYSEQQVLLHTRNIFCMLYVDHYF